MPNRIIKESILTSPNFSRLSLLAAQHFFRILLRADDWGCLECTPAVIRGTCYPLIDSVTPEIVDNWQDELEQVNIIQRWEDGEREFASFCQWEKHNAKYCVTDSGKPTRTRRRTPEPPSFASLCQRLPNPNPNPNPKR